MATSTFSGHVFAGGAISPGYNTTATAAGTTQLTYDTAGAPSPATTNNLSAGQQFFTGSTTQTVKMPKAYDNSGRNGHAAQIPLGYRVEIWNLSSGTVTVQDSAAGAIGTVSGSAKATCVCTGNTTAAGTWSLL